MLRLFQIIDATRQLRFTRTRRACQQYRCGRTDNHALDLIDHPVESFIACDNSRFQESCCILTLGCKAFCDFVIERKIEIDDAMRTSNINFSLRIGVFIARRGKLQKPRRDNARFGQKEPAYLCDVGASGDVHQIIFRIRIERIVAGEIAKLGVDLREIPGVAIIDDVAVDRRCR